MELSNVQEVGNKIASLRLQGYDQIHLSGGTSIDCSFFSGGIGYKYEQRTKEMYFLGLPYCSNFHLKGKSGHNKKWGETPEQTLARELLEETGLTFEKEDIELVFEKSIPDNRPGRIGKLHVKKFYLIKKFGGNLFEFEGPNPIDGETAAPLWIPAKLFKEVLFKGHLEAFYAAVEKLMEKDRDYAYALMNIY